MGTVFDPVMKAVQDALVETGDVEHFASLIPDFDLALQYSLEPTRAGVRTPTFTRATTATVEDHEGRIIEVPSNCARMRGARYVQNLITASEDMTNAGFIEQNGGSVTATELTTDGTTDSGVFWRHTITDDGSGAGGRTFVFSASIRLVSGTISASSSLQFRLQGSAVTQATAGIGYEVSSTAKRFSVSASTDASGTTVIPKIDCDDAVTLEITNWQLEEVTGQTNQNPSEYVSTGVLSSPYHGLMVDGVKAFTYLNGNTVSGGVVTEAQGPAISSSTSKWVELDGAAGTYVSTPDSTAASVTGDITLIAWVAMDDWAPSSRAVIISKLTSTGNQRSYSLTVDVDGTLEAFVSANGATSTGVNSSVATGFADRTGHWIRASWDDSANTVNYYTSDAPLGSQVGIIPWTQLGTADLTLTSAGIYDGTAPVEIGSQIGGTSGLFSGKVSRAVVIASTDPTATPAVDFNANDWEAGKAWESSTGEVWTLQGTANARGPFSRWIELPGASGDYVSSPDSASASVTSDITLIGWAALDDWTPAADGYVIGKWTGAGDQRAYILGVDSLGYLKFLTSSDGINSVSSDSTAVTGFSAGVGHWLRATWSNADDEVVFYTSDDSPHTPYSQISWTQLGNAVAHADTGIDDGTAVVTVGAINTGAAGTLFGKVMRAAVFASTDPTTASPAVDFDARAFTPGVSTATMSTGEVWTLQGNAAVESGIPAPWDADGPEGYLSEGARTNLALHSTPGDLGTTWTDANATPVANYAVAPDGSKTAVRLIDDSATGTGTVLAVQALTVTSATDTTYAFRLKKDQLDWAFLQTTAFDATGNDITYFDLDSGSVGTEGSNHSDSGIKALADGWYLCWVVFQSTTDLTGNVRVGPANADGDATVDLDGTSSILVWGAQVEAGSFPTTYIPTTSAAVTRNADVLTYSAVGNADTFPMTVSADYTAGLSTGTVDYILQLDNGSNNNNRVALIHDSDETARLFVASGGVTQVDINDTTELIAGSNYGIAGAVAANDAGLYVNGASVGTDDTSVTVPIGITDINIGTTITGVSQPNGTIRNVKIFNKRLNDSQVATL